MKEENGRIPMDTGNGSTAKISLNNWRRKIHVELKEKEENGKNRKWVGEIEMASFDFGILSFKYEEEIEFGKRECIIGEFLKNKSKHDYIFLTPITGIHDYGNEILIREKET